LKLFEIDNDSKTNEDVLLVILACEMYFPYIQKRPLFSQVLGQPERVPMKNQLIVGISLMLDFVAATGEMWTICFVIFY
jgi:hypothetical protein